MCESVYVMAYLEIFGHVRSIIIELARKAKIRDLGAHSTAIMALALEHDIADLSIGGEGSSSRQGVQIYVDIARRIMMFCRTNTCATLPSHRGE